MKERYIWLIIKKQHGNELNETWKARYDAEMGKAEAQMQKILANLQKQSATDSTRTEA